MRESASHDNILKIDGSKVFENDTVIEYNIPFNISKFSIKEFPWNKKIENIKEKEADIMNAYLNFRLALKNKDIEMTNKLLMNKNIYYEKSMYWEKDKMSKMNIKMFSRIFKDDNNKLIEIKKENISFDFFNQMNIVKVLYNNDKAIKIKMGNKE